MKKIVLSIVLLFEACNWAYCQSRKVTGRILSSENQEPVKDARVSLLNSNIQVITNYLGFFELNFDSVKYNALTVSHDKFKILVTEVPKVNRFTIILDPKSMKAFYEFIGSNIRYPAQAVRNGIEGVVFVQLQLSERGTLIETKIIADIGGTCGAEVLKVLSDMPGNLYTQIQDKPEQTRFLLPVTFGINKPFKLKNTIRDPSLITLPEVAVTAIGFEREKELSKDSSITRMPLRIATENAIDDLSVAMRNPKKVYRLTLESNALNELPAELSSFTNLTYLNLQKNQLGSLSIHMEALVNLEVLYLSENRIKTIPQYFEKLQSLKILGLSSNQLDSFPQSILTLDKLEVIDLNDNKISSIPTGIGNLERLKFLFIQDNNLKSLPIELHSLKKLRKINLRGNPLSQEEIDSLRRSLSKTEILF